MNKYTCTCSGFALIPKLVSWNAAQKKKSKLQIYYITQIISKCHKVNNFQILTGRMMHESNWMPHVQRTNPPNYNAEHGQLIHSTSFLPSMILLET